MPPECTLIHQTSFDVSGKSYPVQIFSCQGGRHYARTYFDETDVIISDGMSLEEVLAKHQRLIPLAVDSRRLLRDISVSSRRSRLYRGK